MLDSIPGGGLFPTIPAGAPGYAWPVVGGTLVILALIWYFAKKLPSKPDPAPESDHGRDSDDDEVSSSYQVLRDVIGRLATVESELGRCKARSAAIDRRNQDLTRELGAAQHALGEARVALARHAALFRPLHTSRPLGHPQATSPHPAPVLTGSGNDEPPTDPIIGRQS